MVGVHTILNCEFVAQFGKMERTVKEICRATYFAGNFVLMMQWLHRMLSPWAIIEVTTGSYRTFTELALDFVRVCSFAGTPALNETILCLVLPANTLSEQKSAIAVAAFSVIFLGVALLYCLPVYYRLFQTERYSWSSCGHLVAFIVLFSLSAVLHYAILEGTCKPNVTSAWIAANWGQTPVNIISIPYPEWTRFSMASWVALVSSVIGWPGFREPVSLPARSESLVRSREMGSDIS